MGLGGAREIKIEAISASNLVEVEVEVEAELGKKTDDYSGHYVIASSRPPERRPLERRTLAPKLVSFRDYSATPNF